MNELWRLLQKYVVNRGMMMLYNDSIEKVEKHFMNFEQEEQWLQKKLNEGWLLVKYMDELDEPTIYTFKPIAYAAQKNIVYKIDFREFDDQVDYEEYVDMFEEGGWRTLSKNGHTKHIFYTQSEEANRHIFSEEASFKAREERKIRSSLKNMWMFLGFAVVSLILYLQFDQAFFIGGGLYASFAMCRSMFAYIKHKRTLKSMLFHEMRM